KTDNIEFSIQSFGSNKINLGQIKLSDYASFSAQTQLPRLSVIDIASGISGRRVGDLVPTDPTVQVAMRLVKFCKLWRYKRGVLLIHQMCSLYILLKRCAKIWLKSVEILV